MRLGLLIKHHDHDYIERRGGHALYSHLRAAPARCAYRRRALERARDLYRAALERGDPEPEIGGLGLLVLQRAVVCVEDLGALLHSLDRPDAWRRLTSYGPDDIDAVFTAAATDPSSALATFRLPDEPTIAADVEGPGPALDGARELVRRTKRRWLFMLEGVANLWLRRRQVAKATMHGYPIVAGELALGPPPAGTISEAVRDPGVRPFAVALISRVEGTHVETKVGTVRLDPSTIDLFTRQGKASVRLAEELCAAQAGGIERGYGYMIPLEFAYRLPEDQRLALEEAAGDG